MGIFKNKLRTIGDVNISSLAVDANTSSSETWPEDDDLSEDRLFKTFIFSRWAMKKPAGFPVECDFLVDITGPASWNPRRIYSRHFEAGEDTESAAALQSDEWWEGEDWYSIPYMQQVWKNLIIPPGLAIFMGGVGSITSQVIAFEAVLAEARDPFLLYPFIGAAPGGISGLR